MVLSVLFRKVVVLLLASCFLFFGRAAIAQQEFTVSYNTTYTLKTDGAAEVTQEITLSNNFSTIYATSYTLILEGKIPQDIQAFQGEESLPVEMKEEGSKVQITVAFPNAVVGKNKSRTFSIKYNVPKIATRNGQVWDVAIPKLASPETINGYKLTLEVPQSFGNAAYISPGPHSSENLGETQIFTFNKEDLARAGIVATFGQSQIFSVLLTYHLENPYSSFGETEIALPPDTAFQRVYYEKLQPRPTQVRIDDDGNWLAAYRLGPKEKLQIELHARIQIFAKPQEFYQKIAPAQRAYYLSETEYWQVNDPEIKRIASTLKTPRAIYDFVVNRLDYDYSRVREGAARLGAKEALNNPNKAVCMEFTDLFIALARAAGIPVREINGYAYTENPEIQPLSLVADVLHSWPEFWDEERGIWQPVDPTWENTTGGVDFFDKFDLSHITFVIHGRDPNNPPSAGSYKGSGNPQKDVRVEFSQFPEERYSTPDIKVNFKSSFLPLKPGVLKVEITNPGPVALYNTSLNINPGNLVVSGDTRETLRFLSPFDTLTREFFLEIPFLPQKSKESVVVSLGDTALVYNIPLDKLRNAQIAALFASLLFLSVSVLLVRHRYFVLLVRKIWQFLAKKRPNFPR